MTRATVHIIDDDDAVRDALSLLFDAAGFTTRTYGSGEEFVGEQVEDGNCIAVIDMRMTGMSGLEVMVELKARGSSFPVIILTGHGDVPLAVEAMRAGAFDFLQKPVVEARLLDVVELALAKQARNAGQQQQTRLAKARLAALSSREKQVLPLLLAGKPNKVIAAELAIAVRTVEVHRSRILQKMQVKSVVELLGLVGQPLE